MAATWIKPIKAKKGKSVAQTLNDSIHYIINSKKTDDGKLVSGYECNPRTAPEEFLLARQEYESITGREQRQKDVLLYHMRQSFKPGEIEPEEAHRLGYELAMRFTKGKHSFVVATHTDKNHIHCHIEFNAITLDCTKKFRNPIRSSKIVRRISDQNCLENGLSVIENPKPSRGHYGTWLAKQEKLSLIIDLQNSIKAQNSAGYSHWAKVFSLKQASKTLLFLQEHGLTDLEKLDTAARSAKDDYNTHQTQIHNINRRLANITTLQKHIGGYDKTKDIFNGYRRAKDKRKYYIENEVAINTCKAAKEYFNSLSLDKIPTIKALKQEYSTLTAEKKKLYSAHNAKRSFMREVLTARQNVSMMLGIRHDENAPER